MTMRAPRFRRVPDPTPFLMTPRDEAILRHVYRHRFLRSDQIIRLLTCSPQAALRRLRLLFHHGYLNRPETQLRYYEPRHNRPIVYSLGPKGRRHLLKLGVVPSRRVHEKSVKHAYLDHTLLIAEFMSRLETELPPGVKLHYEEDFSAVLGFEAPRPWKVPVVYNHHAIEIGVIPDRIFALSTRDELLIFCLEADRGTMPVLRSNPLQTSAFRKLLAYHETWRRGIHKAELGWNRFRVLTLTSSPERRDHLVELCKKATSGGGAGLFFFADVDAFNDSESAPKLPWVLGNGLSPVYMVS